MSQYDFLNEIERGWPSSLSKSKLQETLDYYKEHFLAQKKLGFSEEEICARLDNPQTIIRMIELSNQETAQDENVRNSSVYEEKKGVQWDENKINWMTKAKIIIGVIVVFIILLIIAWIFFQYIFPIILLVGAIIFLLRLIKGR